MKDIFTPGSNSYYHHIVYDQKYFDDLKITPHNYNTPPQKSDEEKTVEIFIAIIFGIIALIIFL